MLIIFIYLVAGHDQGRHEEHPPDIPGQDREHGTGGGHGQGRGTTTGHETEIDTGTGEGKN